MLGSMLEFGSQALTFTQHKEYNSRVPPNRQLDTTSPTLAKVGNLNKQLNDSKEALHVKLLVSASDQINEDIHSEDLDQEPEVLPGREIHCTLVTHISIQPAYNSRHSSTIRDPDDRFDCPYSDTKDIPKENFYERNKDTPSEEKPNCTCNCKRRHPSQHCEILRLLKISELYPDLTISFELFDREPCPLDSLFLLEDLQSLDPSG